LEPAIPHCELEKHVQEQVADAAVYANFLVSRSAYADTESRAASLFGNPCTALGTRGVKSLLSEGDYTSG
jgi:hypothetical protein